MDDYLSAVIIHAGQMSGSGLDTHSLTLNHPTLSASYHTSFINTPVDNHVIIAAKIVTLTSVTQAYRLFGNLWLLKKNEYSPTR